MTLSRPIAVAVALVFAAGAVSEEAGALPASGERGPAKARIALMLALATGLATSI